MERVPLEAEQRNDCLFEFEKLLNQIDPYHPEMINLLDLASEIDPDLHDVCSFSLWIKKTDPDWKFDSYPRERKDLDLPTISSKVLKSFAIVLLGILVIFTLSFGK